MNVLIVGSGHGSWAMRGVQLGSAIGARVRGEPTPEDFAWADLVVLVKRAIYSWADAVKHRGLPLVWDALDFWEQPLHNAWSREEHLANIAGIILAYHVDQAICATQAMADDIGGIYLPHHSRLNLEPRPPESDVRIVGYDGTPKYLGQWRAALEQACARLGLSFVVNPNDLSTVDIFVAFRDGKWDGWACRQWKSGVKYANAIVQGRPMLTTNCAAWREIPAEGDIVATATEIEPRLTELSRYDYRLGVWTRTRARVPEFSLATAAARYRQILQHVLEHAA